jgi:thioredoxin reductase (NADPH)
MFDVAVIGGGPAGLSACVNAACEGLEAILIADTIGGQAGTSSRIENLIGFPSGISGPSLTSRTCKQAKKFGAIIHEGRVVTMRHSTREGFSLTLEGGERLAARSVVIACGAQYNRPPWAFPFENGKGVHYACTAEVVRHSGHETVAVIGGGNSAGQAATFLASKVKHVHLIIRSQDIADGMSYYLYDRIANTPNIEVHTQTDTKQILPNSKGRVGALEFMDGKVLPVSDVYVMIGATPNCHFLNGLCDVDEKGFIMTTDAFKTSCEGIYAVGDIRSGSIKRVANAAGEGAACIQPIFRFLNKKA